MSSLVLGNHGLNHEDVSHGLFPLGVQAGWGRYNLGNPEVIRNICEIFSV